MRTALAAAAFLIVGLLYPTGAEASTTTIYVGGSGCSDTGTGTASTPYCTIGAAAKVATAGQTVVVAAGTYDEEVVPANSGASGAPITFTAAPGALVTVTGGLHGFTVSTRHDITITGFTVQDTTSNGIYVKNAANVVIRDNVVTRSGQRVQGSAAAGIYVGGTTNSIISHNVSFDNSDAGIYLLAGSTGNQVVHNETYRNARGFVRAAPGIDVRGPRNQIVDNISHDNEDSGIQLYAGGDNNLVAGNVIYHNKGWSSTLGVIGDHGIDNLGVTGNQIVSNSIYDSVTSGINVEGVPASWLTAAVSTATTTLTVGTASGFPTSAPFVIQIDAEQMRVTAGAGTTTWTVQRGVNGTAPAAHDVGTATTKNVLQWNGTVIENNVSVDNAVNCPNGAGGVQACGGTKGNIRVDKTSFVGVTVDYDLMFLTVPGTWGTWKNTQYSSLGGFRTGSGQEANGVAADPRWVDASAGDLHLTSGSAAIDSADSAAAGEQGTDGDGRPRVDDPLTADSGTGPRSYDDRGAYEYDADYPPTAALAVSPSTGTAPLQVTLDASASTDPDSSPIASYTFDFGDGSPPLGPQTGGATSHTYATGTWTATVTVTDTAGLSDRMSRTITVTDPAPTNLVGNAGFESGTAGWNTSGRAGITLTTVPGGYTGSYAAQLTNTTTTTQPDCTLNDAPNWVGSTQAGTYTASAWVRGLTGSTIRIRLREYTGPTFVGSALATATMTSGWSRVTVSYPVAVAGSTLDLTVYTTSSAPGWCFDVDEVWVSRS